MRILGFKILLLVGFVTAFSLSCGTVSRGLTAHGQMILYGDLAGEMFGSGLDFVQDINGDGSPDLAVGAPGDFTYGSDGGAVYIFLGPFDPAAVTKEPDLKIAGEAGTRFGASVAGGFDFNGDGISDFAVSSLRSNFGSSLNGDVFIFFGSSSSFAPSSETKSALEAADIIITGQDAVSGSLTSAGFGSRIRGIGDFDRDGFKDLAVSAPESDYAGHNGAGALFVFLAGRSLGEEKVIPAGFADYIFVGNEEGGQFGKSFDHALNFDAQGDSSTVFDDDFIVGSPGAASGRGSAHIFLGPAYRFSPGIVEAGMADAMLTGESSDSGFGSSVTHLSDVDGDGADDLAVSSYDGAKGKTYLYYGVHGGTISNTPSLIIKGDDLTQGVGPEITSLVIGSGGNLAVGAPLGGRGGSADGTIYIFPADQLRLYPKYSSTQVDILESWIKLNNPVGLGTSQGFGSIIIGDGDINSDGEQDLLVGAPLGDINGIDSGFVVVYF